MEPDFSEFAKILQSGGNAALMISVYFIYKAAHRLSRIELMLEIIIGRNSKGDESEIKRMLREKDG